MNMPSANLVTNAIKNAISVISLARNYKTMTFQSRANFFRKKPAFDPLIEFVNVVEGSQPLNYKKNNIVDKNIRSIIF